MVSRNHARIFWSEGHYRIEDANSANGTFFQDARIKNHVFRHTDAVRCGSLWIRYLDNNAPSRPPSVRLDSGPPPAAPGPPPPAPTQKPRLNNPNTPIAKEPPHVPVLPPETPAEKVSSGPPHSVGIIDDERVANFNEAIRRLQRRIDQQQAELRVYRTGHGGDEFAERVSELESDVISLEEEADTYKKRVAELEKQISSEGRDANMQRAKLVVSDASEIVSELNDVLSNLRINVMAAEGEFEQFDSAMPRPSYELILEALRQSAKDVAQARDLLRRIRDINADA